MSVQRAEVRHSDQSIGSQQYVHDEEDDHNAKRSFPRVFAIHPLRRVIERVGRSRRTRHGGVRSPDGEVDRPRPYRQPLFRRLLTHIGLGHSRSLSQPFQLQGKLIVDVA